MHERTVLLVVVALVLSTAAAGVAVNLLRPSDPLVWRAFELTLACGGSAKIGIPMNLTVTVRQGMLDPKTLWVVFLSLDVGAMNITSSTTGTSPWGYPTVWNLTGLDLTAAKTFNATVVPEQTGPTILYAMVWVPLGDIASVPIEPSGHVNPSGVTVETTATAPMNVTAAG